MTNTFTIADFRVGDTVQAFHPRMFGVVLYGRVERVGTKWLYVDFGEIRGGVTPVAVRDIVENWGEG